VRAPSVLVSARTRSRRFTHAAGVVGASSRLADISELVDQVIQIGSNETVTVGDLAERVKTPAGSRSKIAPLPYGRASEAGFEDMPHRVPNLTKIGTPIGCRPARNLDQILKVFTLHRTESSPGARRHGPRRPGC
jgi:UDP-glucose 4-epimerase